MRIRTSLMATAVLLALGLGGQAWAQQTNGDGNAGDDVLSNIDSSDNSAGDNRDNDGDADADAGSAAANNAGTATSTYTDSSSFSKTSSHIVALTKLEGSIYDVYTHDIGNVAKNYG